MSDVLVLARGFGAGVLLGAVFYGGLWWTVRRVAAKAQGLLLLGSFLSRSAIALSGFCAVARADWQGWAACLLGFLAARIVVSYLVRSSAEKGPHVLRGARP